MNHTYPRGKLLLTKFQSGFLILPLAMMANSWEELVMFLLAITSLVIIVKYIIPAEEKRTLHLKDQLVLAAIAKAEKKETARPSGSDRALANALCAFLRGDFIGWSTRIVLHQSNAFFIPRKSVEIITGAGCDGYWTVRVLVERDSFQVDIVTDSVPYAVPIRYRDSGRQMPGWACPYIASLCRYTKEGDLDRAMEMFVGMKRQALKKHWLGLGLNRLADMLDFRK